MDGKIKKQTEIVKNMLKANMSEEAICSISNITKEELEKIKSEI